MSLSSLYFLTAVQKTKRYEEDIRAYIPSSADTSEGKVQEFLTYLPRRFYRSLTVKDLRPDQSVNECIGDLLHLLPS